jgi:molybdopterin-guanine dinucleotide biosynthesis protein A
MKEPLTGVILAGGKSSRIGSDKAFLKIGNKTLLEIIAGKLKPIFKEIIISSKSPEKHWEISGSKIVKDAISASSSLTGIYSSLLSSRYHHSFVIACDMPLVKTCLIKYLIKNRHGYDVVIPESPKGLEPLCAVYSKNCIKPIEKLIKNNNFKILDFFTSVKVKIIRLSEIGVKGSNLFNVNTIRDYRMIKKNR